MPPARSWRQYAPQGRGINSRASVTGHAEQPLTLEGATRPISGLLVRPATARALYVFAHGAGAGMRHAFMAGTCQALADAGLATLRYQFPYTEAGLKRPDPPGVLEGTVRKVVRQAAHLAPGLPLFAGGKSMGGRMTSLTAAREPLPGVEGIIFFGFPLHASGRPSTDRAAHLAHVTVPMLFLQGTRDTLADLTLLQPICADLPLATLHIVEHADHSFAVLKRSGRTSDEVRAELIQTVSGWIDGVLASRVV